MKPAVATYQAQWELDLLTGMVSALAPRRVLEIGCFEGGTLWHWLQIAAEVVAVDDECRNVAQWEEWAVDAESSLDWFCGRSQEEWVVKMVHGSGPFDFIFIDADHTYEAVLNDFLNYSPMLADGGAIAFHDILPRPGYGVSEVWANVKELDGVRYVEIAKNAVEPGNEGRCGIGVAWLP